MNMRIACPGCAQELQVPEQYAGRQAKCPTCSMVMLIPPPQPPPAASAPLENLFGEDLAAGPALSAGGPFETLASRPLGGRPRRPSVGRMFDLPQWRRFFFVAFAVLTTVNTLAMVVNPLAGIMCLSLTTPLVLLGGGAVAVWLFQTVYIKESATTRILIFAVPFYGLYYLWENWHKYPPYTAHLTLAIIAPFSVPVIVMLLVHGLS